MRLLPRVLPLVAASLVALSARQGIRPLAAAQSDCISSTHPIAERYLHSLRRLVTRTDSVAIATKLRYHLPQGVDSSEVVAVDDPITCARAAAIYYTDRDGSYSGPRPIFVVRMRTVFYVQEPVLHRRVANGRPAIHSIVTDSDFSTIYTHEQSR